MVCFNRAVVLKGVDSIGPTEVVRGEHAGYLPRSTSFGAPALTGR